MGMRKMDVDFRVGSGMGGQTISQPGMAKKNILGLEHRHSKHAGWMAHAFLLALLVLSALLTVASRMWIIEGHRDLVKAQVQLKELTEHERALHVELIARGDLNMVERRAAEELGMVWPQSDQWVLVEP